MPVDKEGNACDVLGLATLAYEELSRTYNMLQVVLNGDFQTGLVAGP